VISAIIGGVSVMLTNNSLHYILLTKQF